MITNARGEFTEVKGPGVVGEQPVLKPGERFEYTSGAPLNTPSGMMGGAYQMESEGGERFDIEIPTLALDRPNQRLFVNRGNQSFTSSAATPAAQDLRDGSTQRAGRSVHRYVR